MDFMRYSDSKSSDLKYVSLPINLGFDRSDLMEEIQESMYAEDVHRILSNRRNCLFLARDVSAESHPEN